MNENNEKKINWKPYIIAGIISLLLGLGIFFLFRFAFKFAYFDSTTFAALILVSSAGLIWISREGFFDFASYGFRQFGNALFSKKPNEFNNYAGYKEYKNETREKRSKYYISVAIVGAVFLLATIIVFIVLR